MFGGSGRTFIPLGAFPLMSVSRVHPLGEPWGDGRGDGLIRELHMSQELPLSTNTRDRHNLLFSQTSPSGQEMGTLSPEGTPRGTIDAQHKNNVSIIL